MSGCGSLAGMNVLAPMESPKGDVMQEFARWTVRLGSGPWRGLFFAIIVDSGLRTGELQFLLAGMGRPYMTKPSRSSCCRLELVCLVGGAALKQFVIKPFGQEGRRKVPEVNELHSFKHRSALRDSPRLIRLLIDALPAVPMFLSAAGQSQRLRSAYSRIGIHSTTIQ
jgi:hypothetical protein